MLFRVKRDAGNHHEGTNEDGTFKTYKAGDVFESPTKWHEIAPEKFELVTSEVPADQVRDVTASMFPDAAAAGLIVLLNGDNTFSIVKDGKEQVSGLANPALVTAEIEELVTK